MSIEEGGAARELEDWGEASQKSMAAVLRLDTERMSAMMKLGFMV